MKQYVREPVNAFTHLFAALLSLIGTLFILCFSHVAHSLTTTATICVIIFGLSLIALYTTSGIYHLVNAKDAVILKLKKLDHSMIFILIAGSYTPFAMLSLTGAWKWTIIITVWSLAILGIVLKVFWINMPRWLSTFFYIGMGWIALFALKPLYHALSLGGFLLLVLGGVMYTVGGIIYGLKKPNISPNFGFHEIFHIFVMLGSLCHYLAILHFVL